MYPQMMHYVFDDHNDLGVKGGGSTEEVFKVTSL